MRSTLRRLATSGILAITALVMASSSVLAGNAAPGRYTFGWDYCFPSGSLTYCIDDAGFVQFVDFADGDGFVKMTVRSHTIVYENGVVVGESRQLSNERSVYIDGGREDLHSVVHVRASDGDWSCVSTRVLKITDFEVAFERWNGPDCS